MDAESKAASEKQLELSRRKIELQNKIDMLQKKKEALKKGGKDDLDELDFGMGGPNLSVALPQASDLLVTHIHNFEQRTSDICITIKE
jgi:hypothetical protein